MWAARGSAVVGLLVLAGSLLGAFRLRIGAPVRGLMAPGTALSAVLCGGALWLLHRAAQVTSHRHLTVRVLSLAAAAIGLLTVGEDVLGWNLGIGRLLVRGAVAAPGPPMALTTAAAFVLVAAAVPLLDAGALLAQVLGLGAALIGFLACVGYLYDVRVYGVAPHSAPALPSALLLVALGLGVAFARPERGLMAAVSGGGAGGFMARRLFPALVAVLLVVGRLTVDAERSGGYGPAVGQALFVVASIVILGVLIWWNAGGLTRIEAERRVAKEALVRNEELLRKTLETLPVGVWLLDGRGRIIKGNPAGVAIWGGARYVGPEQFTQFKGWWLASGRPIAPGEWGAARALTNGETSLDEEIEIESFDGIRKVILHSAIPLRDDRREIEGVIVTNHDITDRKRAEQRVRFLNRLLHTVREVNRLIVREADRGRLLGETCRIVVEQGEFPFAWVGLIDPRTREVRPAAAAGLKTASVRPVPLDADGAPAGRCSVAAAIRGGRSSVVNGAGMCDPSGPCAELAAHRGMRSCATFPLLVDRKAIGALTVLSDASAAFDEEVVGLLEELTADLGFALGAREGLARRESAERALAAILKQREALLNNIPDLAWVKDVDSRFIAVNESFARAFGASPAEIVGKTDFDLCPPDLSRRYRADDARVVASATPLRFEEESVLPDGERRWVETIKTPIRDDRGEVVGTAGIARDVTERRRVEDALRASEERYRRSFDEALTGNFISLPEGRLLACNLAYARILGFSSVAEALEVDPRTIYPTPEVREDLMALLREKKRLEHFEMELRRRDGTIARVIENILGTFDERGELSQVHGYMIDVSDMRRLEDQLRQAQKMDAIGQLAGGVAHDFNNVLTVINGYTDLLLGEISTGGPWLPELTEIRKAGERAASLTRQLLAFSRKQPLAPRVLSLNAVVAEMEKMLRRLLGEHVELQTILGSDPDEIKADPGQIEQVLMNLTLNARDAMPQGGRLTIETASVALDEDYARGHIGVQAGPYLLLAVSDTGCGMAPETLSHIFEPFFTTKEPGSGTGLGLATVFGIVKQSGGHIYVYSEPERGTTFKVYFPRAETPTPPPADRAPAGGARTGHETVLLVEDDAQVRSLARQILRASGYAVLEAPGPLEALDIARRHPSRIDLLVSDIVMPQMNGIELARRLAGTRPGVRTLFVSGYTSRAAERSTNLALNAPFLEKPFSPDALLRKVRELLERPAS